MEIARLLNKLLPSPIKSQLLSGDVEFSYHEISLIKLKVDKFPNETIRKKPILYVKELKNFFSELHKIIIYFNGWLVKYNDDCITVMFGVPFYSKTHILDAALCAHKMLEFANRKRFSVSIGLHTGDTVVGDVGSPQRPQYDCAGKTVRITDMLLSYCSELMTPFLVSNAVAEKIKYYFNLMEMDALNFPSLGYQKLFAVNHLMKPPENSFRVRENSLMQKGYGFLIHEIKETHQKSLGELDILKIEIKDGSIGQAECLAFYALALAEHLGLEYDREALIRSCYFVNLGKFKVKRSILTHPQLSPLEKKFVDKIVLDSIELVDHIGNYPKEKRILKEQTKTFDEMFLPESKILKIVYMFEGIAFPKLYKENVRFDLERAKKVFITTLRNEYSQKFVELL